MSEYICLKHSNFPFQVCKRCGYFDGSHWYTENKRELLPIFLRKDFQYLPCFDDVINFFLISACVCVWCGNVHIEYKCLPMAKVSPDAPDTEQELIFVSSQNGFGEMKLGHQQVCSLNDWVIPSHSIIFKKFFLNLLQFIRLWYTNFSTFSLCLSCGILEVLVYMIRVTQGLLLWMNFSLNLFSADKVDCAFLLGGPLVCLTCETQCSCPYQGTFFFSFNSYGVSRGLMEWLTKILYNINISWQCLHQQ